MAAAWGTVACFTASALAQSLQLRGGPPLNPHPPSLSPSSSLSLSLVFSPPTKPFINQPVGSRAAPDTWHTILAGGPDIVGGGQ
ncbi:hypothetical protein F7725_025957, partial [Dissostichus mawsoni]